MKVHSSRLSNCQSSTAPHSGQRQIWTQRTVETLIQYGDNIEARDNSGRTPLIYVGCRGCKEIVQTLLEAGANIEAQDEDGWTPLRYARCYCHEEIVEILQTFNHSARK